ncbi:hypothetical protein PV327_010424 [Microctonus hyperodae]|uniref:t-SNARE coiled-coil homology domain-containing protein n=1 Tax=Microctonus hyperodae TaxID=165561 RepID=A0AA39KUX7_MICHY|nr:hypothetical protein PV327_010424 [Microctonus hyperodae]
MRPGPPLSSRRRSPRRQQQPFEGPRIDHHHHHHYHHQQQRYHHHNHQQQQQHREYNHVGNSGGFSITTFATTLLLLVLISSPCLALIEPVIIGDHFQQSLDHHQQRSLTSRSTSNTPGSLMWSNENSNIERINYRKSKNLTIGYLTAIKGGLKDRQGLAISGAISMALDEYTTMFQMFSNIMHEYNESLMRYHEKCSSLLHQHRILLRKETASQIFESSDTEDDEKILEDSRAAKLQLSEIQTRHDELLKLEKSLVEIKDLFFEIAFAVEKQGEQLNCVEYFAGRATDDVEDGRNELIEAENKRTKSRKTKIKLFIILGIIVLLLILIAIFL